MAADSRGLSISRRRILQAAAVTGFGLLAGCGRLPGQPEPPSALPRIGYLGNVSGRPSFAALGEGLRELGYVEGRNIAIDTRWSEGRAERYPALAAELVQLRPHVLVTTTTPQTQAAIEATSTTPIDFIAVSDPVGVGFVASLARPGGRRTGQSDMFAGLAGKRLELLKDVVPEAQQIGILWNPTNPATALEWSASQESARTLGVKALSIEVRTADDLGGAFETIARERADALIVLSDGVLWVNNTPQLADVIAMSRLPAMHYDRVAAMAYGPNLDSLYRRAGYYVDRILKAASPADLLVEQPREFDFAINLKTAQTLGLAIPQHVLLEATEVIQ